MFQNAPECSRLLQTNAPDESPVPVEMLQENAVGPRASFSRRSILEHSGAFVWSILEHSGAFGSIPEHSGAFGSILEHYGALWRILEHSRFWSILKRLEHSGAFGSILSIREQSGAFWSILEHSGAFWSILEHPGAF